jgi:mannitol-1-/sugar-/sorbitol-6-phosphatase
MSLNPGEWICVQAILFDMDGTLLDSGVAVRRTWERWAARHGLDADAILAVSHGRRDKETVRAFAPVGVDLAKEVAWVQKEELEQKDGVVPVRGAAAFLASLPRNRVALVTSAPRPLALMRLALADLPAPDLMITAEDVESGKPNPEGYIKAARLLGFEPADCLVIEDAPSGLEAGHASGATVLAVATTLKSTELSDWNWVADLSVLRLKGIAEDGRMCLEVVG